MEKEKLCLRCMRKIGDNTTCPYCSSESNVPQTAPKLPLKTVVGGRYLVGKAICENSEGFTYNAFDLEQKTAVSLRELFPVNMLSRGEDNYCLVNVGKAADFIETKESFLKLWKKLSGISGYTAFAKVYDVFEDLGTIYAVSEFLGEGISLREYLLQKEQGYISWDEARVLFMPVVSALGEIHNSGIIHGGISPTNLIIDSKGKLKITGFSIPDVRVEKTILEAELFDGYAAVEQYGMSRGLSAATDIYSFAAVLYRALIGSTPMNAAARLTNDKLMIPGKFAEQLPAYVINALVNALQILPEERTQSIELLRNELSASPAAAGSAAEAYASIYEENQINYNYNDDSFGENYEKSESSQVQTPKKNALKKSVVAVFIISVVLCLAILAGVVLIIGGLFKSNDKNKDKDTEVTTMDFAEESDNNHGTNPGDITSIKLPDFKGEVYDDIKNNDDYKYVLVFKTEYVDSEQERGTVVSQSRNPGTTVTSLNPMTITLKISNGLEVPDVIDLDVKAAIDELKEIGFKNIKSESAMVAASAMDSNKVYSIVYENRETGDWAEIPSDKRLSSGDVIRLYYYGEYVEPTETTAQAESGETVTTNSSSEIVNNGDTQENQPQ